MWGHFPPVCVNRISVVWTYSPLGWACAVAWNVSEIIGVALPFAPWAFGHIIGCKRKKLCA
jgi:hypothetical protein